MASRVQRPAGASATAVNKAARSTRQNGTAGTAAAATTKESVEHDLAKQLDGLQLTASAIAEPGPTCSRKRDVNTVKTAELDREALLALMKSINTSIQGLNNVKKLGKQPPDPKACYNQVATALDRLRNYKGDLLLTANRLKLEKAAVILVGFLNEAGEVSLCQHASFAPHC